MKRLSLALLLALPAALLAGGHGAPGGAGRPPSRAEVLKQRQLAGAEAFKRDRLSGGYTEDVLEVVEREWPHSKHHVDAESQAAARNRTAPVPRTFWFGHVCDSTCRVPEALRVKIGDKSYPLRVYFDPRIDGGKRGVLVIEREP